MDNMNSFNFRIINIQDGNQIIDRTLRTPYNSLTPVQMLEYAEIDNRLAYSDRLKRKECRTRKKSVGFFNRLAMAFTAVTL